MPLAGLDQCTEEEIPMGWTQIILAIVLVALIIFFFQYRKRQS